MEKKVYILWEGQRTINGDSTTEHKKVVCDFSSKDELITFVKKNIREEFETGQRGDYVRMPYDGEIVADRDIEYAHDYYKPIEYYFRFTECVMK